ncbi:MAG: hypothetical protein JO225_00710 [Candidatus Eremiobacteraeota bacterium]|nr:hypothetical protein [Candidatus Eremiobacteraeota bacterium]
MAASPFQVYVSFSGEQGSKIQNVGALGSDGTYLGLVLGPGATYQELRGLALDAAGRLYVANAEKTNTAVYVFSATINPDGFSRDLLGALITPTTSKALLHPYGVAFDEGNLFVSSQDTNVVSGYAISGGSGMPSAKKLPIAEYLEKLYPKGDYYGGTFVASAQPVKVGKKDPPAVEPSDGGLSMTGFEDDATTAALGTAQAAPPPDIAVEQPDAAAAVEAAKEKARHSVRGIVFAGKRLYVADQAKDRVGIYGHKKGTFHGWVDTVTVPSPGPSTLDKPVGLALSPADGRVYIGSPKNKAIFAFDPREQEMTLVVSSASAGVGDALDDLSGLSFGPDGTLYFGSRSNQQVYTLDVASGAVAAFGAKLDDAPECVLVVPTN